MGIVAVGPGVVVFRVAVVVVVQRDAVNGAVLVQVVGRVAGRAGVRHDGLHRDVGHRAGDDLAGRVVGQRGDIEISQRVPVQAADVVILVTGQAAVAQEHVGDESIWTNAQSG